MFGAIKTESRTPGPVFDPLDSAGAEEGGGVVYRLGRKTFRLNKAKAPFAWLMKTSSFTRRRTSLIHAYPSVRPAAVCKMLARRI